MKKIFAAAIITLIAVISFAGNAFASVGWNYYNKGWHYVTKDYKVYRNETVTIDGVERKFNEEGICDTGFKPTVQIPAEKDKDEKELAVDEMADKVLSEIITKGMTNPQKINAIYDWIRENMSYVDQSVKDNWVHAAYDGFRKKSGDCYIYYGVSVALLTRAGFPVIEVTRSTDNRHWWALVNDGTGWYHFDATPRAKDDPHFVQATDAELQAYSAAHTNERGYTTHAFDTSRYPATPVR